MEIEAHEKLLKDGLPASLCPLARESSQNVAGGDKA
jgi:hypothetical protein